MSQGGEINISGSVIHGSVVSAGTIQDSFNTLEQSGVSGELKDTLTELHKAVATMTAELPEEQANQAARDLRDLTEEATSAEPRRKWYSLSAEGLKEAAENLADIGKPVMELVGKVLTILA